MSAPAKVQAMEALIDAHARELRLPTVRARFRALAEETTRDQQPPVAYLAALLEGEVQSARSAANAAGSSSALPAGRAFGGFRLRRTRRSPSHDRRARPRNMDRRPRVDHPPRDSGTGKTHLAIYLGVLACQQGRRVRSTTLAALANELQAAESRRELGKSSRASRAPSFRPRRARIPRAARGRRGARLPGHLERNERASLIVTTNLPFGE